MSRSPRRSGIARSRRASRVALRPLTQHDVGAVVSWCEGAEELPRRLDDASRRVLAIVRAEEHGVIGVVEYRLGVPEDGWLSFEAVAVEPRLCGIGLESEAVRLVEGDALERGLARRFWAGVDHNDGLDIYFWLRLGYRPAGPDGLPWPGGARRDMICMIRNL